MTEFHALQLLSLMAISLLAWGLPQRWQMDSVSIATMLLLGWFSPYSLLLLCVSSLLVYYGAHYGRNQARIAALLVTYCGVQFLIFRVLQTYVDGVWKNLSLLGLAYYTCRHIHYVIDSFVGRIQADARTFWHYQFFWPVLIAGPIHRYNHFKRRCQRRRWDTSDISTALDRIVVGYAKVVILANYLVAKKSTELLAQLPDMGWFNSWLSSATDWAYLYLQFAGWSDIAIGFSLIIGIRIEENFNKPFLATNLIEFWQRWHMTLSAWCKDYVFTPVLAVTRKPFVAVVSAMAVMGLWHEVSLYYLLWGIYHASGIACCRLFQNWNTARDIRALQGRYWKFMSWLLTVGFIVSGAPVIAEVEAFLVGGIS